jgi:Sec63 Brl domain.
MATYCMNMTNCLQAMIVICSDRGWLNSALQAQLLLQMLVVGSWGNRNAPFLMLPGVTQHNLKFLLSGGRKSVRCVPELQTLYCNKYTALVTALRDQFHLQQIKEVSD